MTPARFLMGTIFLVGERAKRARHSQVCSIENRDNMFILENGSHYRASEVVPLSFQKQNREEGETE